MRISELSDATDVPVATIKYYLREGLVPPGRATAPNQASYDESHLFRLRLVRTLREVGGLGIDDIRAVLTAVDDTQRSLHEVLGVAHHALSPAAGTVAETEPPEVAEVDELIDELGWHISAGSPDRRALAETLASLRRLGWEVDATVFHPHARAADEVAALEIAAGDPALSRSEAVEHAVIGTVVFEAALTALRRLALEHHSALRAEQA